MKTGTITFLFALFVAVGVAMSGQVFTGSSVFIDGEDEPITQQEFLSLLHDQLYDLETLKACVTDARAFGVADVDELFTFHVCAAKTKEYIDLSTIVVPTSQVTLIQAAETLVRSFEMYSKPQEPAYAGYIVALAHWRVIPVGITGLNEPLTRGQVAEMIRRLRELDPYQESLSYESILRYQDILAGDYSDADVIFLGDSITEQWQTTGKQTWENSIIPWNPANLGISGETTGRLQWRLEHGAEFNNISPDTFVLLIGTNDIEYWPADHTIQGVTNIVHELRGRWPQANVILLGIPPRPLSKTKNAVVQEVNEALRTREWKEGGVTFLKKSSDLNPILIDTDGIHLNAAGYESLANIVADALIHLLPPEVGVWDKIRTSF